MRINCIPPEYLADQHLMAEWNETLMMDSYLNRSSRTTQGIVPLGTITYQLSTGHARFFYDKLIYIEKRYELLQLEMRARGFKTNPKLNLSRFPSHLFNDWSPTKEDQIINLDRIVQRIYKKPDWYRYRRTQVSDWRQFYNKYIGETRW